MNIIVTQSTFDSLKGWQSAYQRVYGKRLPHHVIIDYAFDIFFRLGALPSCSELPSFADEPESQIRCDESIYEDLGRVRQMYFDRSNVRLDYNDVLFLVLKSLQYFDPKVYSCFITEARVVKHASEMGLNPNSDKVNDIISESNSLKPRTKESTSSKEMKLFNRFFNGNTEGVIPESILFCLPGLSIHVCRLIMFVCKYSMLDNRNHRCGDTLRPEQVFIPFFVFGTNTTSVFRHIRNMIDVSISLKNPYRGSFVLLRKVEKVRGGTVITLDPLFWDVYYNWDQRRYSFDLNVIFSLLKSTSIFFYILMSNQKSALTLSRERIRYLLSGCSDNYKNFPGFMAGKINPAKVELDAKSPVTFYMGHRRGLNEVIKFYPYHKPLFYARNKTESLELIIGRQAYYRLQILGLSKGEMRKHVNDLKLMRVTGELDHVLEFIMSFLYLSKKKHLVWEVIDDYLKENGLK